MTARLDRCFAARRQQGRAVLVAYLTVGDPSPADSLACARAALAAGADVLELGVPFSDPTADGPVIAQAAYRAIRAGGSLSAALALARALRAEGEAPLVAFTYVNPLLTLGEERVAPALADAGVDALLVVDLPPEEGATLRAGCAERGIAVVPLVAPTTSDERAARVIAGASGFVYAVSVTGVTGNAAPPLVEAGERARTLRERHGLPVVVGFGIDGPERAVMAYRAGADGVVVGTALVKAIAAEPTTEARAAAVGALVGRIRAALDG